MPAPASVTTIDVARLIATARIGSVQVRVGAICGLVTLLDGLDAQIIGYLGPALTREWHLTGPALGQVFSTGLAGMMIGLLATGPLADRFGRRRIIALSAALLGICTMLTATANGPTDLLAYRVAAGIGLGGTLPNALALTGDYCPDRWRATLLTAMFTGFSLGSILGGGLTAAIVAAYGWRTVFVAAGVLTLLPAPLLWQALPDSPHTLLRVPQPSGLVTFLRRINPEISIPTGAHLVLSGRVADASPPRQLFQAGRATGTALIWIACFMSLMEIYFLQNWLPTLLTNGGLGMGEAVLATTVFFAGGIAGGLLGGLMMDRLGFAPVLVGLFVGGSMAVPLIGLIPASLPAVTVAAFLAGCCAGGGQKGLNALAVMFYPAPIRSTGIAWALGAGRIGAILGPLLAGWLVGAGWPGRQVFLAAALPMLGAAAAMLAMAMRDRQRAPATILPSHSV